MRVLIDGADSYLGIHIAAHLQTHGIETATLDLRQPFQQEAFQGFDAVVHVAGIAHQRETEENRALYYAVNRDLAVKAAKAAKAQEVRQFVFFSTMSVYGLTCGHITKSTKPAPVTAYGQSKWEAEQQLTALEDKSFALAIVRPPMVYGPGCKGNYPRLSALIGKAALFPKVENQRSMIYIDCLCAFIRRLLESGQGGLYFPQNKEYVSTSRLVEEIAKARGKKIWQPVGLGWLLQGLSQRVSILGKVFGSLTYDQSMNLDFADEPQLDFSTTIRLTEEKA